jgi:hypothetical protein
VFFENPWLGMGGAGIAFLPRNADVGKTLYKTLFDNWRAYKSTVANRSQANGGWFRSSYFIETDRVDRYNVDHLVKIGISGGRSLWVGFVYQQVSSPKPSTMKCYNVKLSLTFVPA